MKTIEDFFKDNSEELVQNDSFDMPPSGHRERMERKLELLNQSDTTNSETPQTQPTKPLLEVRPKPPKQSRTAYLIATVASAVAVVAIAFYINFNSQPSSVTLTAEQNEVEEVKEYYEMQIEEAKVELRKVLATKNIETQTEIENELQEIDQSFEDSQLPITLFNTDTERYLALTIQRYNNKQQTINHLTQILK